MTRTLSTDLFQKKQINNDNLLLETQKVFGKFRVIYVSNSVTFYPP
jgi:hypothetical protein